MIDNSENGQIPEMQVSKVDPARDLPTATAVAEPDAQTSQPDETRSVQPSASIPEIPPQTETPMTEPAPTTWTEGNEHAALAEPLAAVTETDFSSELAKFRQSFEQVQAEFIGEPRTAVEKAEALIDGLMDALHNQLQRIHSTVETKTDTEQLRVAMLSYRELVGSLSVFR
jgi:hypothetical protein